jgi:hypothetical protein
MRRVSEEAGGQASQPFRETALGIAVETHDLRKSLAKLPTAAMPPSPRSSSLWGIPVFTAPSAIFGLEQDFVDPPCDRLGVRI